MMTFPHVIQYIGGTKIKKIAQNVAHFQSAVGILSQDHVCQGDNGRLYATETCV